MRQTDFRTQERRPGRRKVAGPSSLRAALAVMLTGAAFVLLPDASASAAPAGEFDVTSRAMIFPGPYRAELLKVKDGDTLDMRVAIWPGIVAVHAVRVRGIDAPETWRPACEAERAAGAEARRRIEFLMSDEPAMRISNVSYGAFANRVVADVQAMIDGRWVDLGSDLVQERLAREWVPGKDSVGWDVTHCIDDATDNAEESG